MTHKSLPKVTCDKKLTGGNEERWRCGHVTSVTEINAILSGKMDSSQFRKMISSSRDISEENLEITHLSGPTDLLSFVLICEGTFWTTVLSFAKSFFLATMINLLGAATRIWMKKSMKNNLYAFLRLDDRVHRNTACLLGIFINSTEIRSICHFR